MALVARTEARRTNARHKPQAPESIQALDNAIGTMIANRLSNAMVIQL
jgi:hypothetical protein